MTDEQMQSLLEEGFEAMNTTPEDVERSTRRVLERKAHVRQRSRWWPFPVFYRRTETPTTTDTTDYQPSPIPATNGHSPTVLGRTQSMLSPVKAITAGALVFAIGGAFLIAQPFDQSASVPGADALSEPPIEFTGSLNFGPQTVFGTEEQGDGKTEIRGHVFHTPVSQMSDERLDGEWTRTNNLDQYDEPSVWTWQAMWRVETDDGAWEGLETPIVFSDGSRSTTTSVLVGEGDYEGLVAVTEFDLNGQAWDLRGVIIDGEMPPAPEPANVE